MGDVWVCGILIKVLSINNLKQNNMKTEEVKTGIALMEHLSKDYKQRVYSGIHMTFSNGNTISIQFGMGNYCENKWDSKPECKDAEIAIFNKHGQMHNFDGDSVLGYLSTDEIAKWIIFAQSSDIKPYVI